jgi:hypothetical protein
MQNLQIRENIGIVKTKRIFKEAVILSPQQREQQTN